MAEREPTVVKTGNSNIGLIVLALAIIGATVVGFAYYQSEQDRNAAVSGAASAVGEAGKDVGDAVKPE